MSTRCDSCPPSGLAGHANLSEMPEPITRIDGVRVYAYKCIVCGIYWNRYYEGNSVFLWRSVGRAPVTQ